MAEHFCFAELVNLKAEFSDLSICGRKLSRSSKPRKDRLLAAGCGTPLPRNRALTHGGSSSSSVGNSLRHGHAELQGSASLYLHASASFQGTCHNEKSHDTASPCAGGDPNGINNMPDIRLAQLRGTSGPNSQPLNAALENETCFARISFDTDASVDRAPHAHDGDVAKTDVLHDVHTRLQNECQTTQFNNQDSSFNPALSSNGSSIPSLHMVESKDEGISPIAPLRISDFSSIIQKLNPSGKIKELFQWMKANFTALDVHSLVFKELGKRQEWTLLDIMLKEEVNVSQNEALCEVFNKIFQVCIDEGAPIWARKWFHFMVQEGVQPDIITFRLLMPFFRRYKMFEEAKIAYQHMKGMGIECSAASSAMVLFYVHAGHLENAKQIYLKMQEANGDGIEDFFISQLKSYVNHERVKEAEELMNFMQESGVSLDLSIYNSMITVYGKAGEYVRAKEWFLRIEKDGLHPNEAIYRSIIGACGRAGSFFDALQFYDRMVALRFSPSLVNYNTLIHLHRKVDYGGRILALLLDMKMAGCIPNSATLNSVLKVYERYGRLEKLPEALQLLTEAGWKPDAVCHGFLIRAYIRCNKVDLAMEAFIKLSAVSKLEEIMCHNLICMCKSVGRYEEAIHVFHEMCRSKNVSPSLRTSCAVIDAYSLKGSIEEGEALYKELRSVQKLDAATYNVVLSMFLKAGSLDKAAQVLREVLEDKELEPDMHLFLCMLKVCSKCGLQEEALKLYWRIVNSKMVWTESLYTGVIHNCGRLLPSEEVLKLFDVITSTKMPVNNVTCNLLLDIFGKAGMLEEAENVLRLAQKQGVQDCITFSTMIDAYGKQKKFSEMESTLIDMLNAGYKECVEGYNSMLDAYGSYGLISKMEKTLERMRMAGCSPDLRTFNILIKAYGQECLFKDLQGVLEQVRKTGLKLDNYSYTTLIYAYGSANMLNESLEYFQEMQRDGVEPDLVTYTCLISVLQAGGYGKEASRLSLWIKTGLR